MTVVKESYNPILHTLTRLRKEEEDEQWISGEELNTEGSTEDEAIPNISHQESSPVPVRSKLRIGTSTPAKSPSLDRRISAPAKMQEKKQLPSTSCEPVLKEDPHLPEVTRRLSEMTFSGSTADQLRRTQEFAKVNALLEEQDSVMLWRPKRGSLKLPNFGLQAPTKANITQVLE